MKKSKKKNKNNLKKNSKSNIFNKKISINENDVDKKNVKKEGSSEEITKEKNIDKKVVSEKNVNENVIAKKVVDEEVVNENVKKIEKEIMKKKDIPQEEENKLNKKVFENLLIAITIMIFFYFIGLGSLNIESSIFITDLKVFSIALIVFTIILFEYSYKKENANVCIHGIEMLFLAIIVLFFTCIYTLYFKDFNIINTFISYVFAIYYVGKSMIIYRKMKKEYIAKQSDIEEIIKK